MLSYVDVSGWPGLGKTLCVKEVWSKLKEKYRNRHKFIYINAMIIQNKKDIFKLIFYSMTKLTKSTDSALYILGIAF